MLTDKNMTNIGGTQSTNKRVSEEVTGPRRANQVALASIVKNADVITLMVEPISHRSVKFFVVCLKDRCDYLRNKP